MNHPATASTSRHRRPAGLRRFFYVLIVLAALNPILRPAVDVPVTPYYLLVPVVVAALLAHDPPFRRWMAGFALLALYALAVGTAYGVPLSMQVAQLLKYLQLLAFFGMLAWLSRVDPKAPRTLAHIVAGLAAFVFVLAGLQAVTKFQFPTVVNDESAYWLNTFFFTPNDLALFLGAVFAITLTWRGPALLKLVPIGLIVALNLRNDSKATLIGLALMAAMAALLAVCHRLRVRPIAALALFGVVVPLVVLLLAETTFSTDETDFDLLQLLLDPLERIVALEPYELGGSIFDRTDALIYGLQALRASHGLGIGPAGSVYMLSLPSYELLTAQSLHNALAELLVELGPAFLVVAWIVLRPVLRSMWQRQPTLRDRARMVLLAAAPMLSVSQSSGYISNYAFWLAAYVLWFWPVAANVPHRRTARKRARRPITPPTAAVPA